MPNLHDDFGIRSTYSAAQNDAGFVRLLDYISRNPHASIDAPATEFDRSGPVQINISQEISIAHPFSFTGGGSGFLHSNQPGVRNFGFALNWAGAAGATMVKIAPAPGARALYGVGLRGVALYGNDLAARLLDVRSLSNFDIQVSANGATDTAIYAGVVSHALAEGERRDLVHGTLQADIAQVGAASGKCFVQDGDEVANVCKNSFVFPSVLHKNAVALDLRNGDTNVFEDCIIHNWGSASNPGIVFRAGQTLASRSRAERFENGWEPGAGGVTVEGTDVAPYASSDHEGPWPYENYWNLTQNLRIGPGASFNVTNLKSAFSAHKTNGSFSSWSPTDITGWGAAFNQGNCFNATTGEFTAPIAGVYQFSLQLFHVNTITPGSRWELVLKRSGSGTNRTSSHYAAGAIYDVASVHGRFSLMQGETVRPQIRCVGVGGVFEIVQDAGATRFDGGIVR